MAIVEGRVMKLIDLTHAFTAVMPVYPGDPASELKPIAGFETDGYVDYRMTTGMHVGTHIDGPFHMVPGGKKLADFPLEKFFGRGILIDARGKKSLDEELLATARIRQGDIVLFHTGLDRRFREPDYFETFPEVSEKLAERLAALGVKMIGLDTPSPDRSPYPVHKILLHEEILIIENLTGLEALLGLKSFEVIALPSKFEADSAPARVVARIL